VKKLPSPVLRGARLRPRGHGFSGKPTHRPKDDLSKPRSRIATPPSGFAFPPGTPGGGSTSARQSIIQRQFDGVGSTRGGIRQLLGAEQPLLGSRSPDSNSPWLGSLSRVRGGQGFGWSSHRFRRADRGGGRRRWGRRFHEGAAIFQQLLDDSLRHQIGPVL
jgi:hypothetical protein